MTHSKTLEDTKLWKVYLEKNKDDLARTVWTEKVYKAACNHLKAVRDTFGNYTLHDEKHVLNVMDAMAGLLGNRICELSLGETELLILVAALHDIGMVYTENEREACLSDPNRLGEYYNTHSYLRSLDPEDWDEIDQQNYLRWLHPFRVGDVLQQTVWCDLFNDCPKEAIAKDIIIAVCRAHGETPNKLRQEATDPSGVLKYQKFREVDPLFCAILLRLADILDFDDSRVPATLFSYAERSEKSVEEWKKHMESIGFKYWDEPCSEDLLYGARFTDPSIERSARTFLDWIDEELSNSRSLLSFTNLRWNSFPFPYQVDRSEIERIGYDFGDFKITMDQGQIMDLLIGENLYTDRSVFVRELLQNSIDATLLRAEMDSNFADKLNTDEARIDLWEWWDDNGNQWFRIDDRGTGMTKGMLRNYFLKAGRSYYNSNELKRDLNGKSYSSISRFGIGFLSCFLCGQEAYVSTKYWNPAKNIREAEQDAEMRVDQQAFGLRLDVVGLTGYYTLRNQAIIDNQPEPMPTPPASGPHPDANLEINGYRSFPGTSIAIRIDTDELFSVSLLDVAKHWACFPKMLVYFNGKRLCLTQNELIAMAKDEKGVREYELSYEEKEQFNLFLPELKGNYPKIRETIDVFEAEQIPGFPKLKILFCETRVIMEENQRVFRKNRGYLYTGCSSLHKPEITIYNADENGGNLVLSFQPQDHRRLLDILSSSEDFISSMHYGWKGVFAYHEVEPFFNYSSTVLVLDDGEERPDLKANREHFISFPLKTALMIISWLEKYLSYNNQTILSSDYERISLKEWRKIDSVDYRSWLDIPSWDKYQAFFGALKQGITPGEKLPRALSCYYDTRPMHWKFRNTMDIRWFFLADLQLHYRIVVDYSKQQLRFEEMDLGASETQFDLFPPMPFCYGNTERDRKILCAANAGLRLAFTADHPFLKWILKNAIMLSQHYPRQFNYIVSGLQHYDADILIGTFNQILEVFSKTANRYGIDVSECPRLTMSDFWEP